MSSFEKDETAQRIADCRADWQRFLSVIRRHPAYQWLDRLSVVERDGADDLSGPDPSFAQKVQPFQRIAMADAAIRFSNDHRGDTNATDEAWTNDIAFAGHTYLNTDWNWFEQLHSSGMNFPMARMYYEQLSLNFVPGHIIGRAFHLFSAYDDVIRNATGLSFDEITRVALFIWGLKTEKKVIRMSRAMLAQSTMGLDQATVDKFLAYYMADYKTYRAFGEGDLASDVDDRYRFRPLIRYPLVSSGPDIWCPVASLLLKSVFDGLFFLVLDSHKTEGERGTFLTAFGERYEKYVTELFHQAGFETKRCDDIPRIKGARAEFFTTNSRSPIVVECKRFTFCRDTLLSGSFDDFSTDLDKLSRAFEQIENTLLFLRSDGAKSIIATYAELPFSSHDGWKSLVMKERLVKSDPLILSTDAIECMCSLSIQEIESALEAHTGLKSAEKGSFVSYLRNRIREGRLTNRWLMSRYDEAVNRAYPMLAAYRGRV
jgi:hypothetical protein